MSNTPSTTELDMFLRRAYVHAQGLPEAQKRQVLKLCLAYLCKDVGWSQRQSMVEGLAAQYGIRVQGEPQQQGEVSSVPPAYTAQLLASFYGDNLPDESADVLFERMLEGLDSGLRRVCQLGGRKSIPWSVMLRRGESALARMDDAMQTAATQSFERLLNALDPIGARKHTERKKWHFTPLYKSELYDSIVEKFKQLKAYHDKGRLVRDFRSLYRDHCKQNSKKTESS